MKTKIALLLIVTITCIGLIAACKTGDSGNSDNTIKITFNANGGVFDDDSQIKVMNIESGGKIADEPEVTRDGYEFIDWNTQADGDGDSFDTDQEYYANETFFAVWEEAPITIIFDPNGGAFESGQPLTANGTFVIKIAADAANKKIAAGQLPIIVDSEQFIFVGWNTNADGSGEAFSSATEFTANATFYAIRIENRTDSQTTPWFWATYDDQNDGGSSTVKMTIFSGEEAGIATDFVYHFKGTTGGVPSHAFIGGVWEPNKDIDEDLYGETFEEVEAAMKSAKGFKFKTKGDGNTYAIMGVTSDTAGPPDGTGNHDNYVKTGGFVAPANSVAEITVTMSGSTWAQGGWGIQAPFIVGNLLKFQWQAQGTYTNWEIMLWDFELIP